MATSSIEYIATVLGRDGNVNKSIQLRCLAVMATSSIEYIATVLGRDGNVINRVYS